MRVVETVAQLQALADRERAAGHRLALVPTMGALHAGHLSLIARARERADRVWVSIFVNPTQFDSAADVERYPRTLDEDLRRCGEAGVDLVFAPSAGEMYPRAGQAWVEVGEIGEVLCGASRPGHFRAVATIVAKLLLAAKPHVAVFGEKDYQQLVVIRALVGDLGVDVEIASAPIAREPDGLALSSRNRLLHPEARAQAVALARALDAVESALAADERDSGRLRALAIAEIEKAPLARIDYAELCDAQSLRPIEGALAAPTLLALAVWFDPPADGVGRPVRLIDNRVLVPLRDERGC
ncbi:MAG TPA: pantoate--beta-alanine ligase [Myxococcota bacterium]|nr:pantoate--beta-alanine ligase [Myxococcota bacterium]